MNKKAKNCKIEKRIIGLNVHCSLFTSLKRLEEYNISSNLFNIFLAPTICVYWNIFKGIFYFEEIAYRLEGFYIDYKQNIVEF